MLPAVTPLQGAVLWAGMYFSMPVTLQSHMEERSWWMGSSGAFLFAPLGFPSRKSLARGQEGSWSRATWRQSRTGKLGGCQQSTLHKVTIALCKLSCTSAQRPTCLPPRLSWYFNTSSALLAEVSLAISLWSWELCNSWYLTHLSACLHKKEPGPTAWKKQSAPALEQLIAFYFHSEGPGKKTLEFRFACSLQSQAIAATETT